MVVNPTKFFNIGIFTHLKLCLADAIHNFKFRFYNNNFNDFEFLLIDVTFYL